MSAQFWLTQESFTSGFEITFINCKRPKKKPKRR